MLSVLMGLTLFDVSVLSWKKDRTKISVFQCEIRGLEQQIQSAVDENGFEQNQEPDLLNSSFYLSLVMPSRPP